MHVRSLAIPVVLASLVGSVAAQPAPTPPAGQTTPTMAADRRSANALYKEGVRLFNAGTFADALDLFEQAYHRYPDARILFSIASTQRQLGKSVAAANSYQRYIDDPGAEPQLVAETRTVLQALDVTLGRVEITFQGETGEVQIDDGIWMPTGTKLVRVQPGSFILRGRHPSDGGHAEVTGKAGPGESTTVTLSWIVPPVPPKPIVVAKPDPKIVPVPAHGSDKASRYLAYGLGGGAFVLGGLALFLEITSRSKISDAETICPTLQCAQPGFGQATSLLDSARSRRNGAIITGGLATAAIGAGVYFFLRARSSDATQRVDTVQVMPVTGANSVGLVLDGSF